MGHCNTSLKHRDPYFDVVKAFAITFVLFGHAMGLAPANTFPIQVRNFIVGMNMPIFFVVSGYFLWPVIQARDLGKMVSHLRSYFQPAVFAAVVYLGVCCAMGEVVCSYTHLMEQLFRCVFKLMWFIVTLSECYVVLFLARQVCGRRLFLIPILIFGIILAILSRPQWITGDIHFSCFINMLPHFYLGCLCRMSSGRKIWEMPILGGACFVVFIVYIFIEGNVDSNGLSFYKAGSRLVDVCNVRGAFLFVVRFVMGVAGVFGVMSMLKILLDWLPRLGVVSVVGEMTLGIYLFHCGPLELMHRSSIFSGGKCMVVILTFGMLLVFGGITWMIMHKCEWLKKLVFAK